MLPWKMFPSLDVTAGNTLSSPRDTLALNVSLTTIPDATKDVSTKTLPALFLPKLLILFTFILVCKYKLES
jgi:hypothetical protein